MKILRLKLDGFGRFGTGLAVEFETGAINVILGRNETGKSTLAAAIEGLIFGLEKERLERYRPWNGSSNYRGQIVLETPQGHLRIVRDFDTNRVRLCAVAQGKEETLYQGSANPQGRERAYFRLLSQLIGFADGNIFRNTTFVPQTSIESNIDEELRRLLTGSGRGDYVAARRSLEEEYFSLTRENPWGRPKTNERTLEALRQQIAQLQAQIAQAEMTVTESARLRQETSTLEAELTRVRRQRAALEQTLGNYQRYQEAVERSRLHHQRLDQLSEQRERLRGLKRKLADRQAELRRVFPVDIERPEIKERILALGNTVDERNSFIARMDDLIESSPKELPVGPVAGGAALGVLGLISGIGLALTGVSPLIGALVGVGLLAGGGGLVAFGFTRRRPKVVGSEVEDIRNRLNELDGRIGGLVAQVFGPGWAFEPIEFGARYRDFRTLDQELQAFGSAVEVLGNEEHLETQYRTAVSEAAAASREVDSLAQSAPYVRDFQSPDGAVRLERLRQEIAEIPQAIEAVEARLRALEREASGLQIMAAEPESLREEIELLEQKVEVLELRKDALAVAVECLTAAVESFRAVVRERIEEGTGELFRTLTGSLYRGVKLDPDFRPQPIHTERAGALDLAAISRGAQDQLHLALRLALATELSGRVSPPPFILDDPFVNFDKERLTRVRILLKAISANHQVILFTHSAVYRDWGKVVLDLDRG